MFHIVGFEIVGSGTVNDTELTVLYVPTSYGAVDLPPPGGGDGGRDLTAAACRGPQTPDEIAAEIRQETQRHIAALRAEQERQRLEMQRLRAELAEVLARQRGDARD